jgi:hypothetical protein
LPDKDITDEWFKNKRIISPKYFNRYFSYSVMKGEISDVVFQDFLDEVLSITPDEVIQFLKDLIDQSSPDNVLYKLRSIEEDIDWEKAKKIAKGISSISELFPTSQNGFFMSYGAPKGQAAIFVFQLIKRHNNITEQYQFTKELFSSSSKFDFTFDLYEWLQEKIEDDKKLFSDQNYKEFDKLLLHKAINESAEFQFLKNSQNMQMIYLIFG